MPLSVSAPRPSARRPILVAVAVVASVLAAFLGFQPSTAEAQAGECVTATNSEHESAGRASSFFVFYFAEGSGDYLGIGSTETSLQGSGGSWTLVDACGPGTTTTTDDPGPGDRPPLEEQYQATYETDFTLPGHTIYRPENLDAVTEPMPIVVWGNGGCVADGTWFQEFLQPLSAHGVLVIANGTPNGSGSTTSDMLIESIDWAVDQANNPSSELYGHVDTESITAMGQSCGGIEAIEASSDARVDSTVAWNSGLFGTGSKPELDQLHGPAAWFTGGPSDIAYSNAINDYEQIGGSVPAVLGHYGDVGHFALFTDPEIERHIITVAADWLDATLYDNGNARQQFVGPSCGLCSGTEWDMTSKNW